MRNNQRTNGHIAPPTERQLAMMRAIRRHEQRTGNGVSASELLLAMRFSPRPVLAALEGKGWVEAERDGRNGYSRWHLTDEGVDIVDGPMEVAS